MNVFLQPDPRFQKIICRIQQIHKYYDGQHHGPYICLLKSQCHTSYTNQQEHNRNTNTQTVDQHFCVIFRQRKFQKPDFFCFKSIVSPYIQFFFYKVHLFAFIFCFFTGTEYMADYNKTTTANYACGKPKRGLRFSVIPSLFKAFILLPKAFLYLFFFSRNNISVSFSVCSSCWFHIRSDRIPASIPESGS